MWLKGQETPNILSMIVTVSFNHLTSNAMIFMISPKENVICNYNDKIAFGVWENCMWAARVIKLAQHITNLLP